MGDKINMERISEKEREYVLEVLNTEFCSSQGSMMMKRLEEAFAAKFGVKYAVSHVNGTATMHSALAAADVGLGDEVIVPPLTMSATTFAVLHNNAVPVFADIDPETFNISPQSIRERITPRTRAIIPVALYGLSPDMDEIMAIAKEHQLVVIEDDAQCFLGKYKERYVGTIGHMASFSFQSSKHMTSGEGGMIVTDDVELATRVRRFSSLGYAGVGAGKGKITKNDIQDPDYDRHVSMGWNYRLPELCAAVLLGQVERLDELVQRRIDCAKLFADVVADCSWLTPQKVPQGYEHAYWTYVLKLEHPHVSWREFRDKFQSYGGDGIYAAWKLTYLEPMFQQMHLAGRETFLEPPYCDKRQQYRLGLCPVAEAVQPKLLQLKTNYWNWDEAEQQAEILRKTMKALG